MRRGAYLALLGLMIPAGLACLAGAAATPASRATESPGVLLDVPFVPQTKNECGAAALSMVMLYWEKSEGLPASPRAGEPTIQHALDPGARGITNAALAGYLQDSGFRTFAFSGRWSDLRDNLAKGRPLIAALGGRGNRRHYIVVAGIDWARDFVFVNDPARRKLVRMERGRFEDQWKAAGNWTLLAVPEAQE